MKISKFLLTVILIPIVIGVIVACYFQYTRYQILSEFMRSTTENKYLNFMGHFDEKLGHTQKIPTILSQNKQITESLNQKQFQFLNNEAQGLSKLVEDEIYFTDTNHKILVQSGSTAIVGSQLLFNEACSEKQLLKIGNELKIYFCSKLLNADKTPLGYVLAMRPLSKEFLQDMAKEISIESEISFKGTRISSLKDADASGYFERHDIPYKVGNDTIHITIMTDNSATPSSLHQTFAIMLAITILVGLVIIFSIPYFIKKYISSPLLLIEKKISLFYKNEIVDDSGQFPENEAKKIYLALHQLQISVKEKSETLEKDNLLLRVISHDVSNTLTVIQGSLLRLRRSEQITMQKKNELLDKILATVRVAGGVLQHVKEIKALETGKMDLKLEPTSINEIFDVAQIIFEDRLSAKEIKLTLEDLSNGSYFLCHKSSFTNSVFNNFISNAIKFSSHGSEITIKAYTDNHYFSFVNKG